MSKLDTKAVSVIEDYLNEGDKDIARFVYEHNHGKAKQQVDQTTTINITVTGGEILRQIRQVEQDSNAILEQREPVLMAEYSIVEEESQQDDDI